MVLLNFVPNEAGSCPRQRLSRPRGRTAGMPALTPRSARSARSWRSAGHIAGCAISAGGMVMLALLPGPWAYLAALAVAGFGSGLAAPAPYRLPPPPPVAGPGANHRPAPEQRSDRLSGRRRRRRN